MCGDMMAPTLSRWLLFILATAESASACTSAGHHRAAAVRGLRLATSAVNEVEDQHDVPALFKIVIPADASACATNGSCWLVDVDAVLLAQSKTLTVNLPKKEKFELKKVSQISEGKSRIRASDSPQFYDFKVRKRS